MLVELISYLIAGSMAGILAGMFGVGGGILIVPILTFIFLSLGFNDSYVTHLAVGTSLSTIIFTGLSSARAHFYKNAINFQAFYPVAIGISIGCIAGAFVANLLDGIVLRKIIGIFALLIAIQIYIAKNQIKTFKASSGIAFISGSGIGVISTNLDTFHPARSRLKRIPKGRRELGRDIYKLLCYFSEMRIRAILIKI